jgi:hypothetical protein
MKIATLFIIALAVVAHAAPPVPLDERINVDFPDEYRASILRSVGELYDLNLVIPTVFPESKISLKLKSATWKEILELCLYGSGFTYVIKESSTVMIVPLDNDVKAVEVLHKKLDAELTENESWRAALIQLINEDIVACDPESKAGLQALILNVDNSPQKCVEMIRKSRPNQALVPTPMSVTPAADAPVAPATGAAHL